MGLHGVSRPPVIRISDASENQAQSRGQRGEEKSRKRTDRKNWGEFWNTRIHDCADLN